MTVFAAFTLAAFTVAAPLAAWRLLTVGSDQPLTRFLLLPYRISWARWMWVVPLRFGRKLYFAALMSAWNFADPSTADQLALVIFVSLIVLLLVQLLLSPYKDPRDNYLEVACLLLLLYGYFVSVLPGASTGMSTSVVVLQVLLVVYGAFRWARRRLNARRAASRNGTRTVSASALSVELLSSEYRELDGGEVLDLDDDMHSVAAER
jgi:hypothetical protein